MSFRSDTPTADLNSTPYVVHYFLLRHFVLRSCVFPLLLQIRHDVPNFIVHQGHPAQYSVSKVNSLLFISSGRTHSIPHVKLSVGPCRTPSISMTQVSMPLRIIPLHPLQPLPKHFLTILSRRGHPPRSLTSHHSSSVRFPRRPWNCTPLHISNSSTSPNKDSPEVLSFSFPLLFLRVLGHPETYIGPNFLSSTPQTTFTASIPPSGLALVAVCMVRVIRHQEPLVNDPLLT